MLRYLDSWRRPQALRREVKRRSSVVANILAVRSQDLTTLPSSHRARIIKARAVTDAAKIIAALSSEPAVHALVLRRDQSEGHGDQRKVST